MKCVHKFANFNNTDVTIHNYLVFINNWGSSGLKIVIYVIKTANSEWQEMLDPGP